MTPNTSLPAVRSRQHSSHLLKDTGLTQHTAQKVRGKILVEDTGLVLSRRSIPNAELPKRAVPPSFFPHAMPLPFLSAIGPVQILPV